MLRFLFLSAFAATASAQAATATPTPPPLSSSTCYPEYQSVFHWLNSGRTEEYSYDLRTLCGVDRFFAYPIASDPTRFWYFFWQIGAPLSVRASFAAHTTPLTQAPAAARSTPVPSPRRQCLTHFFFLQSNLVSHLLLWRQLHSDL